jgi:uncharacterized protein
MNLYNGIHSKVSGLLDQLPDYLTYHSPAHTAYVIDQAELIAQEMHADPENLLLIRTGALFHDIGFIRQYQDHEEAGCDIAREILGEFGLEQAFIDEVCSMIMATKAGNIPVTLPEKILKDADLEYLGTGLFFQNSKLLYQELKYFNPELDEQMFRQMQIQFISGHEYYTDFCRMNREERKREHLRFLMAVE